MVSAGLFVNLIELRLRTEPACQRCADRLICKCGLFISYLACCPSSTSSRCVCHELGMAALLHTEKPEDGGLDGLTDSQQPMVLEKSSFLVSKTSCNVFALLLGEDNAIEGRVEDVILHKIPSANAFLVEQNG